MALESAEVGVSKKVGPHRELGRLLLQAQLITEDQLAAALVLQRRLRERLASVLVRQGVLTEKFAVDFLGKQLGVPGACLSRQRFDLDLLQLIPLEMCERRMVFPLRVDRGRLTVAMKDPLDLALISEIERHRKVRLLPSVALEVSLRHTLHEAREALKAGRWRVTTDVQRLLNAGGQPAIQVAPAAPPPSLPVPAAPLTALRPQSVEPATVALPVAAAPALPRDYSPAAHSEVLAAEPEALQATILIVQAEGPGRASLERLISEVPGYRVVTASSGSDAFGAAPDVNLVVVDAALPDTHGLELCRRLHAHCPEVPILLLSTLQRGWRFAREVRDALGIAGYVEKPYKASELLAQLRVALGRQPLATPALNYARKHLEKGLGLLLADELGDAQAAFLRGLALDPGSEQLNYYAGMTFEKQGRAFEAIDHYEEAVRLNPEFEDALALLAGLYEGNGFRLKAVEAWERALDVARDEVTRRRLRAHIAELQQDQVAESEPSEAA